MRIGLAWFDPSDPTDRSISENIGRELRRLGHEVCLVGPKSKGVVPDIWHCHVFGRSHGPFIRTLRRVPRPMVLSLHLVLEDYLRFLGGKRGLGRLLALAQHVTVVSRFNRAEFLRLFPGWRGRCSVVPYGAPAIRPGRARRPYILSVARLAPYKGQDLLLLAFARARDRGLRHRLVLCGRDQLRGGLQEFARTLGISDHVEFMGELPTDRVSRLLRGCAFMVLPSRRENLPLAVLEAMAAGKAVLASAVGGVPELVRHGRESLLVPPNDVAALARGMLRLGSDPRLARRLGRNALRRSQGFSWSKVATAYARLYARLPGCARRSSSR